MKIRIDTLKGEKIMRKGFIKVLTATALLSLIIMVGGIRMMMAAIRQTHGSGLMVNHIALIPMETCTQTQQLQTVTP